MSRGLGHAYVVSAPVPMRRGAREHPEFAQTFHEVCGRCMYLQCASLEELAFAVTAAQDADGADSRASCREDVVCGVADEQGVRCSAKKQRRLDDVGLWLCLLNILTGGGTLPQRFSAEETKVVVEMAFWRGTREDDIPSAVLSAPNQLGCTRQRTHLRQQGLVVLLPGQTQFVPPLTLRSRTQERRHQLITAHSDQPVYSIRGDIEAAGGACALPGDCVEIRGIDERSVDIQKERYIVRGPQYHLPRTNPPNATSPMTATIMPITTLQMTAMITPEITKAPPIPIPIPLPERSTDDMTTFRSRPAQRSPTHARAHQREVPALTASQTTEVAVAPFGVVGGRSGSVASRLWPRSEWRHADGAQGMEPSLRDVSAVQVRPEML